jgi:hypothetical protein
MKRNLLVAAALAVVLVAAKLPAEEPSTLKTVKPDWHYRWHEGRWWYSMPDNKWVVWSGSAWVPFEQFSSCPYVYNVGQPNAVSTSNASSETASAAKAAEPVYSSGGNYSNSVGSGGNYAGYGWSWGPGTAFRDSPGRRF